MRKLRDLRRLERRLAGTTPDGAATVWEEFFATTEGVRVRYPLGILRVFDRASRERAFRDYLVALWARYLSQGSARTQGDRDLLKYLGLDPASDPQDVRAAFRRMALELHPDVGGDDETMSELIERYRRSSFGGGTR